MPCYQRRRLNVLTGLNGVLLTCMLSIGMQNALAFEEAHSAPSAPKPLYRDPVHDGAADPSLIWDGSGKRWLMFYTNRRADLAGADQKDVAWVHGTQIGIAESKDRGSTWQYVGIAKLPYGKPEYTFWAPALVRDKNLYHMFVTVVPGIFHDWNAPREIIHLTSRDLSHWKFDSKLSLSSNRVIDPCVFKLPNGHWLLWYKDEQDHSYIHYATSPDLFRWAIAGHAITDRPSEGPIVFRWKGAIWMIVDAWAGLGVYRSTDAIHWTRQQSNLLATPGETPTDRSEGHHADVIVSDEHAFLFYFVQQGGPDAVPGVPSSEHRSVLQVVELNDVDNELQADRDKPAFVMLSPGADK
jgi:hypothetical protein